MSWHQTQAANPNRDEAQVLRKLRVFCRIDLIWPFSCLSN